jgi:hypothetical protein
MEFWNKINKSFCKLTYCDMRAESQNNVIRVNVHLLGNSLLMHGCCRVDASSHDNECVRKPESRNSPLLGNVSRSTFLCQKMKQTNTQVIRKELYEAFVPE